VSDMFQNPGYLIALAASQRFHDIPALHAHGLDHQKIAHLYASILQVRSGFALLGCMSSEKPLQ